MKADASKMTTNDPLLTFQPWFGVLLSRAISLSQLRGAVFLLNVCFSSAQSRYTAFLSAFALNFWSSFSISAKVIIADCLQIGFASLLFTSPAAQGLKGAIFFHLTRDKNKMDTILLHNLLNQF